VGLEEDLQAPTTQSPAEPAPAAPPERLEQKMTRALDDAGSPAPAAAPAQAPDGAPTLDGLPIEAGPAAAQQPAPAEGWQGVRDYLKGQGIDLPYSDDAAALNALARSYQQLQERNAYAELGQRLQPHIGDIQEFLRRRQAPAEPAPAWAPPPFRKEWLSQVERDEGSGQLRAKPGFDPAVAERVQAYADWRERFLDNPEQVVAPLVESRAQALIERKFAEHQQQTLAQQLIQQHAPWLYQHDPSGRPVPDPRTGQPQLSPAGVVYAREARRVYEAGIADVREMDRYARLAAENAALRGALQQSAPAAAPPAQQRAAQSAPAVGGGIRPAPGLPNVPASLNGLSLQERLRVAMKDVPEDVGLEQLSVRN
jgi:hypothetical protein